VSVTKGGPGLELLDAAGKVRAVLGSVPTVAPDGRAITYPESSLFLFGPDGNAIWKAP
jgi:hypothetical protein